MRSTFPQVLLAVVAAGAAVAAQAQQPVQQEQAELKGVYSFVGALDGEATLFAARSGAQSKLEIHLPILRGDRIWTRPYGRLAVLMSDRSILALDHDSEVTFTQIAGSPDADDVDSLYVLHRGRLSLEVADHLVDSELPAVDTTNARIYAKQQGRYQVESDGDAWTEVAVLEGFAEVVTQRGSVIVRGGEALRVQGLDDPWIELQNGAGAAAAALDEWTDGHRASLAAYAAVDANGYGSALASHGNWVEIEDRQAWKPEVEDDWQPYSRGRWTHTPAGLYWVARDPWGPLTYHYGSWNLYPGHGWLWFPSAIYSPSHVYWYWGPSYVGWIPRGYYQRYYGGWASVSATVCTDGPEASGIPSTPGSSVPPGTWATAAATPTAAPCVAGIRSSPAALSRRTRTESTTETGGTPTPPGRCSSRRTLACPKANSPT